MAMNPLSPYSSSYLQQTAPPWYGFLSFLASMMQTQMRYGLPVALSQPASSILPQFIGGADSTYDFNPFAQQANALADLGRSQLLTRGGSPVSERAAYRPSGSELPGPAEFDLTGPPPQPPAAGGSPGGIVGGPTGIMDLSSFKLMLPTGRQGSPDMVAGPQLSSYQSPYFQQGNGALTFFAPVNGVHSANSQDPQSELGEAQGWKMGSGQHSLSAKLSVDQVPSTGDVTVGQLHQRGGSGRPPIMISWKNGKVEASVLNNNSPSAKRTSYVLADNVPKGQPFSYSIDVAPDGSVGLDVNGKTTKVKLDPSFKNSDMYFKAGVYVHDNQGGSQEGAKATFTGLKIGKGADKPAAEPQADKTEKPKKPAKK